MGRAKLESDKVIVIADANILIDLSMSNKRIISLLSKLFSEVHVPIDIINEVNQLSENEAKRAGLIIYYPEPEIYYRATNEENGTSFQDKICLYEAQQNQWGLITNDKKLRKECSISGVKTFWGLEVLLMLFHKKLLSKSEALKTANKIYEINRWITSKTLEDFKKKLSC